MEMRIQRSRPATRDGRCRERYWPVVGAGVILVCGWLGWAWPTAAQVSAPDAGPRKLVIYPQAIPTPPLRYTLLPPESSLTDDNAAVIYGKVARFEQQFRDSQLRNSIPDYEELAALPGPELLKQSEFLEALQRHRHDFETLRTAALCRHCDWELPKGKVPFLSIVLDDIQRQRLLARLVYLRMRVQMAEGDFAEAGESLQTLYAIARHTGQDSSISCFIGAAAAGIGNEALLEWIQQPEAPNLYCATLVAPRPFLEFRRAIELERDYFRLNLLFSDDDIEFNENPEYWQSLLRRSSFYWADGAEIHDDLPEGPDLDALRYAVASYPNAKQILRAQGFSEQRIAAMPVAKTLVLAMWHDSLATSDAEIVRLMSPEMTPATISPNESSGSQMFKASSFPYFDRVLRASRRVDRGLAVVQLIEGLRHYAATHAGQFPPDMAALQDTPAPLDPWTGQPFRYEVAIDPVTQEQVAYVEAVSDEYSSVQPVDFEIRIGRN